MRCILNGIARNGVGHIVPSATVSVYLTGTTTAASIYTTLSSTTAVNSVTAATDGTFTLYVDRFDYDRSQCFDIAISKSGYDASTWSNVNISEVVLGTYTISTDKTVTTDLGYIPKGVIYSVSSGKTLTINGSFDVGQYQIFSGTGAVTFSGNVKEVYPEWFGAQGDGVTNDRNAINDAFISIEQNGGTLVFSPKTYYISNYVGNTSLYAGEVRLEIIGKPGCVIDCDPAVYDNYAFYLSYQKLKTIHISGLTINGNNKTNNGIYIYCQNGGIVKASVKNCDVSNIKSVDNAAVTSNTHGIVVYDEVLGQQAEVTGCTVTSVTKGKNLAAKGIFISGFDVSIAEKNIVTTVSHDGTNLYDADGISVFSASTGASAPYLYRKSVAVISGNIVSECDGRFVKLQTNGRADVSRNLFKLEGPGVLISDWRGVDSQSGSADIHHNTFQIGDSWTGGASAALCSLARAGNVPYDYETSFQKFTNNDGHIKKMLPYGVSPNFVQSITDVTVFDVSHNNILCDKSLAYGTQDDWALTYFIYTTVIPTSFTGEVVLNVYGNTIYSYDFINLGQASKAGTYARTNPSYDVTVTSVGHGYTAGQYVYLDFTSGGGSDRLYLINSNTDDTFVVTTLAQTTTSGNVRIYPATDLTDKLIAYIYDNFKPTLGYARPLIFAPTGVRTSSIMVKNNALGSDRMSSLGMSVDLLKLLDGCDFHTTDSLLFNAPTAYAWRRIAKHGGIIKVESAADVSTSTNGIDWTTK